MKKRLHVVFKAISFILLFCFLFHVKSSSQSLIFRTGKSTTWEAGIQIGPSFFLGDLGGNAGKGTRFLKDLNLQFTNVMKGIFFTAYPSDRFGIRFSAQTGFVQGDDGVINTKGVDELWRKQRNLDFKSAISEAYVAAEIFPLMFLNKYKEDKPTLNPYVVIGVGVFHFNPQGSLTDSNGNKKWYYLRPLRTEGEGMAEYPDRKEYNLTQINIPIGGGLKYYLSDRINLSLEVLDRKTFTDYIDDVSTNVIDPALFAKYLSPQDAAIARQISDKTYGIVTPGVTRYAPGTQRGNPKQDDTYFSFLLKIGVRLGQIYESDLERRTARQVRCPAKF